MADKMTIEIDIKQAGTLAKIFPNIFKGERLELSVTDIQNLGKLVKVGIEMRNEQALFDRTRSDRALGGKKNTEATFDKLLTELADIIKPPNHNPKTLF
jgi:uncharacterized membrane-anchored protein